MYNAEHYNDPTVAKAFEHIARKEKQQRMNTGKRFEQDWKMSTPKNAWYKRFKDNAGTFYGGDTQEGVRFTPDEICDCQIYQFPYLHLIELKTTAQASASLSTMFGKWNPDKGMYKKQKHLVDMLKASQNKGVTATVVINFRSKGDTYAIDVSHVFNFIRRSQLAGGRKSIPISWCETFGKRVDSKRLKVNYRYDVQGLLTALAEREAFDDVHAEN